MTIERPYNIPTMEKAAKVLERVQKIMPPQILVAMSFDERSMFLSAMVSNCIFMMVQEASIETVQAFLEQAIRDLPRMQREGQEIAKSFFDKKH